MNLRGIFFVAVLLFCILLGASTGFLLSEYYEMNQKIVALERDIIEQEVQLDVAFQLLEEVSRLQEDKEELYQLLEEWLERWQVETFAMTAYTLSCGNGDGFTATMTRPKKGRTIAVDPNIVHLGTPVFIDGWGWRVAEDTGGLINGQIIDLYMGDEPVSIREAYEWGRRDVLVVYEKTL